MRLLPLLFLLGFSWVRLHGQPGEDLTLLDTESVPLVEGTNDLNIAKVTSRILQHSHYLKQTFDDDVSSRFLDRYLDALDNLHIYFLDSDLNEFETYRHKLDELTYQNGDTAPARIIFDRFRERVEQQYRYVFEALKKEKFDFTGDDRYVLNRRKLPRPTNLEAAKKLWHDRLRYEYLQEKLNKQKHEEIIKLISLRYTRMVRTVRGYDNDDVIQIYLTALAHIYDPHSDYLGKSELENFSIGMKLSLFGIGALLRSEDGFCKIESLVPEGPAEKSKKLKPNDKIIAVAQGDSSPVDVADMKLRKVVELIRGPEGSEVRLTIIPAAAEDPSIRQTVTLVREKIKLEDQAAKAKIIELPSSDDKEKSVRLGLIDLPSFYAGFEIEGGGKGDSEQKSTTTDVSKLLRKLKEENVAGVILDLRRNGGGSLEEAINLTGLFIKEGTVVQVKDSNDNVFQDKDTDPSVLYDGPLIVLTSRFSASASEILAGALQDYGRALIVGDASTHGKGTVQSLIQLAPIMRSHGLPTTPNPGAVKITIRKFYRASGHSTQLRGVIPDIVLPSINNHAEVGEASLENPLKYDPIDPANYEKLDRVAPQLAELKKRSNGRIAKDPDFAFVAEEIERYKKAIADKSVSLNEALRRKEKEEADTRLKARNQELAQRTPSAGKVYDITLKQAELPGLPEPAAVVAAKAAAKAKLEAEPVKEKTVTPKDDDADDTEADNAVAPVDTTLEEAKRILLDFIALLSNGNKIAATTVAPIK